MNNGKKGQCARRCFAATEFLMRSHGRMFSHAEFMQALKIPRASAHRLLGELQAQGWVEQDEDTLKYRMSLSFRNMLVATGLSLRESHEAVGAGK